MIGCLQKKVKQKYLYDLANMFQFEQLIKNQHELLVNLKHLLIWPFVTRLKLLLNLVFIMLVQWPQFDLDS